MPYQKMKFGQFLHDFGSFLFYKNNHKTNQFLQININSWCDCAYSVKLFIPSVFLFFTERALEAEVYSVGAKSDLFSLPASNCDRNSGYLIFSFLSSWTFFKSLLSSSESISRPNRDSRRAWNSDFAIVFLFARSSLLK